MERPDVLIAGAGPTGLNLALWLKRLGLSVLVVDTSAGPGETSRAIAVHARTLEYYQQLGLAADIVSRGRIASSIRVRVNAKPVSEFDFGDREDAVHALSPFPFVLIFPQDEHERLLVEALRAAGVEVRRRTELLGYEDLGDRVRAELTGPNGPETVETRFLCGCDGAHSTVRRGMGTDFPGGTYARVFYVADVRGTSGALDGKMNFCLGGGTFCIALPLDHGGLTRIIGTLPREVADDRPLTFAEVSGEAAKLTGATFAACAWFSSYRVHHRVADSFRKGNVFLLGDAGHIHSPAGGQGMNTGIGDAANLAWKLAAVLRGRAAPAILASYESERLAFAKALVGTTDRAFEFMVGHGPLDHLVRTALVRIAPELLNIEPFRVKWFEIVSQILITYRGDPISEGAAGAVRGGDRLPWAEGPRGGNYARLTSLDWQIHVYGKADPALAAVATAHTIPVHELAFTTSVRRARLREDAMYLVRPDGHVGLAQAKQDPGRLESYLTRHGVSGAVALTNADATS